jgi:hypothetical protein
MIKKKKSPSIGDKIEHTCRLNGKFEGKVIQLLAAQFVYETEKGFIRHCMFREEWRYIDEK